MIEKTHEPWIKVGSNNKRHPTEVQNQKSKAHNSATFLPLLSKQPPNLPKNIPPIPEETDLDTLKKNKDNTSNASSDAKQSALIPNLNVSLNDGTHRITFRMKTTIDTKTWRKRQTRYTIRFRNSSLRFLLRTMDIFIAGRETN